MVTEGFREQTRHFWPLVLPRESLGYECHHHQNLMTMRGAKSKRIVLKNSAVMLPAPWSSVQSIGLPSPAYDLLPGFDSIGERGGEICCHSRDDPVVRAIDQIVQVAGRDGPEYG